MSGSSNAHAGDSAAGADPLCNYDTHNHTHNRKGLPDCAAPCKSGRSQERQAAIHGANGARNTAARCGSSR